MCAGKIAMELSPGKYWRMRQCSTQGGVVSVLALDHRNNLRSALNPSDPQAVSDEEMAAFKQEVVSAVGGAASAVLLDPEVGAAQSIISGALPRATGLICAVEETGYTGNPTARASRLLPGWSVAKAARLGAQAVKLLVYYHPQSPTAGEIEKLVAQVAAECVLHEMPFFLEPLSYSLNPGQNKLAPSERRQVVLETARRLIIPGVDVLKAEFPLDISAEPEEKVWAEACAELSSASRVPWVLLSASADFETYLRQVRVACEQGASGVAAGRAIWQEAPRLGGVERSQFLAGTARERMNALTELCESLATPWTHFYQPPSVSGRWYETY
jgi:tagatose 1,6-diphosphate aldolase